MYVLKDNAATTLYASCSDSVTTITVTDATKLPTTFPYLLTLWNAATSASPYGDAGWECVLVTAATGNDLTVTRAQVGSTASGHSEGEVAQCLLHAAILQEMQDAAVSALPVTLTSAEQGDIIYHNGTAWVNLGHGTAGQYLRTGGNAANPAWTTLPTPVSAPATTAENTLQPSAATAVPLTLKGHATQSADLLAITTSADAALLTVDADGDVTIGDAQDVAVGTTTGTKLGTAATQKLGLWGATPVVQPAAAAQAVVTLGNADSEIGGLTISAAYDQTEVQALRDKCEELADDVRNLSALVHALRTALVDTGIVKGAA